MQTRIVRVEGEHADHLTPTMAQFITLQQKYFNSIKDQIDVFSIGSPFYHVPTSRLERLS